MANNTINLELTQEIKEDIIKKFTNSIEFGTGLSIRDKLTLVIKDYSEEIKYLNDFLTKDIHRTDAYIVNEKVQTLSKVIEDLKKI